MELDDAELVARSQGGDLVAFNGIVERYQTQVYNMAARVLGNRTSAEDVAQETFVSAYKAIGRFRGGSLRAWLLRIASNLSIDDIRTSRRRPEASLDEALLSPGFQPVSREESPEHRTLANELAGEIQQAILSIPNDQRTILVLIDVQGLSYEETADSTGVSIGTVKSRLNRARRRVRDHLKQHRELLPERFRHI